MPLLTILYYVLKKSAKIYISCQVFLHIYTHTKHIEHRKNCGDNRYMSIDVIVVIVSQVYEYVEIDNVVMQLFILIIPQ